MQNKASLGRGRKSEVWESKELREESEKRDSAIYTVMNSIILCTNFKKLTGKQNFWQILLSINTIPT